VNARALLSTLPLDAAAAAGLLPAAWLRLLDDEHDDNRRLRPRLLDVDGSGASSSASSSPAGLKHAKQPTMIIYLLRSDSDRRRMQQIKDARSERTGATTGVWRFALTDAHACMHVFW
jgi:hypothetical protein